MDSETLNSIYPPANTGGLISIAIPTFNRPIGLANTLADIRGQTYQQLEILIGDNASTDSQVRTICDNACSEDRRVRVVRHETNIGAYENFRSLLQAARGDYFMWAADDDRHSKDFVATCVEAFLEDTEGKVACVMTGGTVLNYVTNKSTPYVPPLLTIDEPVGVSLLKTIMFPCPAIIYGVFRRSVLCDVGIKSFDWSDCFLPIELQCSGYRIRTLPAINSYTAGILSTEYIPKPAIPGPGRLFLYRPYIKAVVGAICKSSSLSVSQRIRAIIALLWFSVGSFRQWERKQQPVLWWVHTVVSVPFLWVLNKFANTLWINPSR